MGSKRTLYGDDVATGIPKPECAIIVREEPSPVLRALLLDLGRKVLADPDPRTMDYDCERDELIYHRVVTEEDRANHLYLGPVEEVWIVTDDSQPAFVE